MGLLTMGQALDWSETKPVIDHVKYHGILQFINVYRRLKDRRDDCFKWGDEIEYMIVKFDHENKKVRLSLRGGEILNQLTALESSDPTKNEFLWRPECAAYMLEGTPGKIFKKKLTSNSRSQQVSICSNVNKLDLAAMSAILISQWIYRA